MSYRDDFKSAESHAWWTLPRVVLAGVFGLALLYGAGFLMTGGDLAIYSFWAPKQANAENQVFHNTQAYTDGKNIQVSRLCKEAAEATGPVKEAYNNEILTEVQTMDYNKLSPGNQTCVDKAKGL